ncbi:hypothetical protein D3C85_1724920 [compost metagenome]
MTRPIECSTSSRQRASLAVMPTMQCSRSMSMARCSRRIESKILKAISGSITFSCSWPPSAAMVSAKSLPMTWNATWFTASGMTGLTLPGMIELPG